MKQINFLGQLYNVIDDDDIEKARASGQVHLYIVVRVADADPHGGTPELLARRLRTPCEGCGEICYMDPKSLDSLKGLMVEILCAQCAMIKMRTQRADG